MSSEKKRATPARPGKNPLVSVGVLLCLVLFAGVYLLQGNATLSHLIELKNRQAALEGEAADLIRDIHALKEEIRELEENPEVREKMIREEYGYAKAGETVIWVSEPSESEPPPEE